MVSSPLSLWPNFIRYNPAVAKQIAVMKPQCQGFLRAVDYIFYDRFNRAGARLILIRISNAERALRQGVGGVAQEIRQLGGELRARHHTLAAGLTRALGDVDAHVGQETDRVTFGKLR